MYTSVYVRAYSCKVQADAEVEEDGEDKKPEEVTMEYLNTGNVFFWQCLAE